MITEEQVVSGEVAEDTRVVYTKKTGLSSEEPSGIFT